MSGMIRYSTISMYRYHSGTVSKLKFTAMSNNVPPYVGDCYVCYYHCDRNAYVYSVLYIGKGDVIHPIQQVYYRLNF